VDWLDFECPTSGPPVGPMFCRSGFLSRSCLILTHRLNSSKSTIVEASVKETWILRVSQVGTHPLWIQNHTLFHFCKTNIASLVMKICWNGKWSRAAAEELKKWQIMFASVWGFE
jgi:hypothetical protein